MIFLLASTVSMKDSLAGGLGREHRETERLPTPNFAHRPYSNRVAKTQWWLARKGRKHEVTSKSSNMMQLVLYKTSVCDCKCNAIHFHQTCEMNSVYNEHCEPERLPIRSQSEVTDIEFGSSRLAR